MNDALSIFASHFTPPRGKSGEAQSLCIPSLTGSADAFLALTLTQTLENGRPARSNGQDARSPKVVLAITPGLPDADRLADDLRFLSAKLPTRILEFPPLLDGDRTALGLRLKTIAALKAWSLNPYPCVVVASFSALSTPIPMGTDPIKLSLGGLEGLGGLADRLAKFGYERHPQVEKEGDYSIRG